MAIITQETVRADLSTLTLPLRSEGLFGDRRPLEVEIGVGKGTFLVAWAEVQPAIGLLGVERIHKYFELAARKAVRRGVANVRVVHTTAEDLLFRCLSENSVSAVHVYFPDPWPKKRHHKRRFFSARNVARVAEVLLPGGVLYVKSDHSGYAELIVEVLDGEPRLVARDADAAFAAMPPSGFETKYIQEGRPIFRYARRRREDA